MNELEHAKVTAIVKLAHYSFIHDEALVNKIRRLTNARSLRDIEDIMEGRDL